MMKRFQPLSQLFSVLIACFLLSQCSLSGNRENESFSDTVNNVSELFRNDEWVAPDTSSIPRDEKGDLIRYGRELVANTGKYFGPKGKLNHFANGMNCQNCHLDAGTKLYANSFSAVASIYPKFRARSVIIEIL